MQISCHQISKLQGNQCITTTIRTQPCSKCGTILQTFFSDKISGVEKNDGGIVIIGQSMN
jgi:hypothetical protein